jgi:hypothetical protein
MSKPKNRMENDSMTPPKQPRPIMFGNKNQEVDIPDFLKKTPETRVTITEPVLQEFMRHEYCKGIITGWMRGFLTGILVPLTIGAILMTLGII